MSLIRVSADNPAALLAAAVLIFVLGVVGIASLPIQMLPNLEYPEININTSWRNAAPQEVEANIIEPQETVLRQVPGVVEMSSDVRAGNGNVHLVFDVGTDLQQAMLDVLNALNRAEQAPPGADEPSIQVGGSGADEPSIQVGGWDFPVATLLVHPKIATPGTDVAQFQRVIEAEVEPALIAIDGVQRVNLNSQRDSLVLINFDPYRAAGYGYRQHGDARGQLDRRARQCGPAPIHGSLSWRFRSRRTRRLDCCPTEQPLDCCPTEQPTHTSE